MAEPEIRRRLRPADLGIGQLFGVVGDAVIVGDAATGRIVLWNPSAERLFGYSADEAVGLPIEVLVPAPLKGRHREGLARFAASGETHLVGTGRSVEVPALRKDSSERWVELTLSPAEAVGIPGHFVLALVRDVTERRNAHAQLAASADQLAAANRSLREFLVMAAHDLRTPLSSILAAAELITKMGGCPADEVMSLNELIVRQVNHLSALIADLAEMGAIEAGEVRTSPDRLLVAALVAEAQEVAGLELPGSSVAVSGDLSVWADPVHVRRIITNYLANARHYAGTGISL
jgi:PAS domain S-box-containing protein